MKVPVSWLREFVDIDLPLEELAHTADHGRAGGGRDPATWGWPACPEGSRRHAPETKISGLAWERG